jgi:chemotaxis protein methyltransferase CheR
MKPHLKEKISFKQHNLIEPTAPGEGVFDLVLCRNVLIYFSQDSIEFVSNKLYGCTKGDGHLFIGHSESFQNIKHNWKACGPSVFAKGQK